jgi:hypothetical protein
VSEAKLLRALARKYREPEWALLEHVPDGTGFTKTRTADAMAMNLWPSRGLAIHGFECKSFRGDWLQELRSPAKAEAFHDYCDFWWLVTEKGVVADVSEIPATWGWMLRKGAKLYTQKDAPALEPAEVDKPFLASILRKVSQGTVPRAAVKAMVEEKVAEQIEAAKASVKWNRDFELDKLRNLAKEVEAFKAETGIEMEVGRDWSNPSGRELGRAVKSLLENETDWHWKELRRQQAALRKLADSYDEVLEDRP